MKLLYLANIRFPTERAHGAQIAAMCEAFADAGASVTLVTPQRAVQIREDPYGYYGVKRNFATVTLGRSEDPHSRIGYMAAYAKFVLRLPFYCMRHRADVYYSRDESIVFILSLFGMRAVWEAHGWKRNVFTRYFLKRIQKIIAITNAAKKQFVADGIPEHTILVAPDGVPVSLLHTAPDRALAREKLGLPAHGTLVFYIGSLRDWKGYRTLLQCAETLASQQITVVIVGGIVEKLQTEFPKAIFLDFIPYRELATVQAAADVLVIPNSATSIVSTEYTSPLKLFAHMASSRPIVASNVPSLREILDEETAYFFEPDNAASLAQTIRYVVTHPEEAQEKAHASLVRVQEYTWEKRARNILTFIGT